MGLNLVLVPQRQSSKGMALAWGELEGVQGYEVFVAHKRLSPEELEAAQSLGGTDDCLFARVGPEVKSVVDDVTPAGEPRFYAVAVRFADGTVKPARFRALPDGATSGSLALSSTKRGKPSAAARAAAPAPAPQPAEDPLEARKRAQREARARVAPEALTEPPGPAEVFGRGQPFIRVAPAAEPPARPRAAPDVPSRARPEAPRFASQPEVRAAEPVKPPSPTAEPPPPPASIPLERDLELRMTGANQTWDGLRICWDRDPGAAAYEVVVSDHRISGDELKEALAGRADFTTAVAVSPSVTAVIDNVTARDTRGWYAVLARSRDGRRAPHAFRVGDAASTGVPVAPFLHSNRTAEVRAEAEAMVEEAREQWRRWTAEHDGGARAEARRLVNDALLVFPGLPAAKALAQEMG